LQILLAEDNPTTQVILKQWLEAAGHRPYLVGNGEQALAMLETHPFDLAIIDLQMPILNGHEVIMRYRQQHPDSSLPLIVLTADTTPTARVAALSANIEAFLTKPVSPEALLAAIKHYGIKRLPGKFHGQAGIHETLLLPDKPVTSMTPGVLRLDKLEHLRHGKTPGIVDKLARTYLDDAQRYLKQIETALESREWDTLSQRK
jgi:two-component system sensor histidine kinase RpfC